MTSFLSVKLISVLRHQDPCRDIDLSPQLEVCCNIGFLCCDQASSTSERHLS